MYVQNFTFQYPSWLILLCVIGAFIYALFLYYNTRKFEGKDKSLKIGLSILRFLSVLIIGILLLGPIFKTTEEEAKKPTIAIIQDASQSIDEWTQVNDPTYLDKLKVLSTGLQTKYQVDNYAFGNNIVKVNLDSIRLNKQLTNIDQALQYISDVYEGDNLGAVILATDGIFNDGKSPLYTKFNHLAPINSIALGDTTRQNDLILKRVLHNEIGYLNDRIAIQADIQAYDSPNGRTTLTVQKKNNDIWTNVYKKDIAIQGDNFFTTEDIELDLNQVGIAQFRIALTPLNGEKNRQNNQRDIFIDVLDARQNIWILANAPHPDLGSLKQLLERNKNYEVTISYELPANGQLRNIDLVIFHNLPSSKTPINGIMTQMDQLLIPRMFILGNQVNLPSFNNVQKVVNIKGQDGVVNESQGILVEKFSNFIITPELSKRVKVYPPLSSPFGEYQFNVPVSTLILQRIGNISTDYPMLSFSDQNGIKTTYLFGEGLWRWKYFDYIENGNFEIIGELIDKSILYTSTVEDKRKFRVSSSDKVYLDNEDVIFTAELYNNSYELVNESEVFITLRNDQNQDFPYTFSPDGKTYRLNIGTLAAGSYSYQAQTLFNGEKFEIKGKFIVKEIQYELYDFQANHNVLYSLAQKNEGKVYYSNQMDQLLQDLLADESLKPIIYQNQITKSVLDFKWLFALLALLLGAEWFLRRYFGSI